MTPLNKSVFFKLQLAWLSFQSLGGVFQKSFSLRQGPWNHLSSKNNNWREYNAKAAFLKQGSLRLCCRIEKPFAWVYYVRNISPNKHHNCPLNLKKSIFVWCKQLQIDLVTTFLGRFGKTIWAGVFSSKTGTRDLLLKSVSYCSFLACFGCSRMNCCFDEEKKDLPNFRRK